MTECSEVIVRATGMGSLSTLTFSGQGTNTPHISGLGDQALTVNAILESNWDNNRNKWPVHSLLI